MAHLSECRDRAISEAGCRGPVVGYRLPEPANVLERLVQIMRQNERLDAERKSLTVRLCDTRLYLAEPGSNVVLGRTNLGRLKAKYAATLTFLRANRIEAEHILGRAGRPAAEATNQVIHQ